MVVVMARQRARIRRVLESFRRRGTHLRHVAVRRAHVRLPVERTVPKCTVAYCVVIFVNLYGAIRYKTAI